jgi:hypothetical protein
MVLVLIRTDRKTDLATLLLKKRKETALLVGNPSLSDYLGLSTPTRISRVYQLHQPGA